MNNSTHPPYADTAPREIVLKVEGLHVAVRRSDLKRLAKRLEQFGYLSIQGLSENPLRTPLAHRSEKGL